jgi:hypothetical protein
MITFQYYFWLLAYQCFIASFYDFSEAIQSGFWYGETRPPFTQYDTIPYVNLTVKINRSYQDGPGGNLVHDPFNPDVCYFIKALF